MNIHTFISFIILILLLTYFWKIVNSPCVTPNIFPPSEERIPEEIKKNYWTVVQLGKNQPWVYGKVSAISVDRKLIKFNRFGGPPDTIFPPIETWYEYKNITIKEIL